MVTAFKKNDKYSATEAFERIKKYIEENPDKEIDGDALYKDAGLLSSVGITLWINTSGSNKCGIEGIKSISWAR
jgi:hypothetical protein